MEKKFLIINNREQFCYSGFLPMVLILFRTHPVKDRDVDHIAFHLPERAFYEKNDLFIIFSASLTLSGKPH